MVEHVLAKDETGVRFSLAAQNYMSFTLSSFNPHFIKILSKSVDNYVSNVYKGHQKMLSLIAILSKIRWKIKVFL